jgi:uncharacterized radical SAM superfamily Fe-S cluster-containing enzyme
MKVYIYRILFTDANLQRVSRQAVVKHNLARHYRYFKDIIGLMEEYETHDPEEADFFFVPIFLTGLQFENIEVTEYLKSVCQFIDKKGHLVVSTGDFPQRVDESLNNYYYLGEARANRINTTWLEDKFSFICLESTPALTGGDVAFIPYVEDEFDRFERNGLQSQTARKDVLCSFIGTPSYSPVLDSDHIRGGRLAALLAGDEFSSLVHFSEKIDLDSYKETTVRSFTTLCPAGFGRWTFRFTEAIQLESIPLLVSDNYLLPPLNGVEWAKSCIRIPENEIGELSERLMSLSAKSLLEMTSYIRINKSKFQRDNVLQTIIDSLKTNIRLGLYDPKQKVGGLGPGLVVSGDIALEAIGRMRAPKDMHIICIDITNKCDLHCSNCTRLLESQEEFWDMTPENFRLALRSLKGYTGTIAIIGGNPCMHPQFERLCEIFVEEIPNKNQRGLWSNNVFKHHDLCVSTFGGFNLNPHGVERGVRSLKRLHDEVGIGNYYEGHSHHAPLLAAIKDVAQSEQEMWSAISNCDINREWSASIVQNKGNLRAYFCEVAAAFDLANGTDNGITPEEGWWREQINSYEGQIKKFCPNCGVPAKLQGHMDYEEIDDVTPSNLHLVNKISYTKKGRKYILLKPENESLQLGRKVTQYTASHVGQSAW